MASVTAALRNFDSTTGFVRWTGNVSIGSTFSRTGAVEQLDDLRLQKTTIGTGIAGQVSIFIVGTNSRFTDEFEATGRIIIEASDGETLEVMIANADMTETYIWIPANSTEVIAFAQHVDTLTDQNATLTLTDDPIGPPPFGSILYTATDSDGRMVAIDIDWTLSA